MMILKLRGSPPPRYLTSEYGMRAGNPAPQARGPRSGWPRQLPAAGFLILKRVCLRWGRTRREGARPVLHALIAALRSDICDAIFPITAKQSARRLSAPGATSTSIQ